MKYVPTGQKLTVAYEHLVDQTKPLFVRTWNQPAAREEETIIRYSHYTPPCLLE
jgi:hypothetical protein